jgi:hypothetical protein
MSLAAFAAAASRSVTWFVDSGVLVVFAVVAAFGIVQPAPSLVELDPPVSPP